MFSLMLFFKKRSLYQTQLVHLNEYKYLEHFTYSHQLWISDNQGMAFGTNVLNCLMGQH